MSVELWSQTRKPIMPRGYNSELSAQAKQVISEYIPHTAMLKTCGCWLCCKMRRSSILDIHLEASW